VNLGLILALALAAQAEVEEFGEEAPAEVYGAVPVSYAARPLMMPRNNYEIFVEVPVFNLVERDPNVGLVLGARHGFKENFELGVILWPLIFYKGVEFDSPSIFFIYRLLEGDFELGPYARVAFPFGGNYWEGELAMLMLIRGGRTLRLDTGPRVIGRTVSEDPYLVGLFAKLTVQITQAFRLAATSGANYSKPSRFFVPLGGELFYTFSDERGADVDLGVTALFPSFANTDGVEVDRWVFTLAARFYVQAEPNPLDEDF
jgi:hypothetical protein